jgi:hypothetical protein
MHENSDRAAGRCSERKKRNPDKNDDNIDVTPRKSKGTAVISKSVSNHTDFYTGVNLWKIWGKKDANVAVTNTILLQILVIQLRILTFSNTCIVKDKYAVHDSEFTF